MRLKDRGSEKEETELQEKSVEYYKDLSDKRLKESLQLAEQLICLRSDLEKKSMELMKNQKQNSSYYSEPMVGVEKTPKHETIKKVATSANLRSKEQPPEPQTYRPTPYPLLDKKNTSPSTPVVERRKLEKFNSRPGSGRPNSLKGSKLQPPNVPYSTAYHPFK